MGSDVTYKPFRSTFLRFRKRVLNKRGLFLTGFVVIFLFIFWSMFLQDSDATVSHASCTEDQPLAIIKHNFLPMEDFLPLQQQLPNHPLIHGNDLNQDSFNATRGWLVKFNLEGIEQFKRIADLQLVLPFFERVRKTESNAFVMNLLIADQTPPGKDAVGVHQDNTVGIDHEDDFYAHQVDVLYVKIPEGFQGGELEAWDEQFEESEYNKIVVQPSDNTLVEFKGTAFHRVRRFTSNGEPRIGLVLEQYRIEPRFFDLTVEFCLNEKCDEV